MGDYRRSLLGPCGSNISGLQQQEGEEAASFLPEAVGVPWNRFPVGLGTPEASGEAGAGTGLGRPRVRAEERAGERSGRTG